MYQFHNSIIKMIIICVLVILFQLYGSKAGNFEGNLF